MNIRSILLAILFLPFGLSASTALPTARLSAEELAAMHSSFANSGHFEEILRTQQLGKDNVANMKYIASKDRAMLKNKFAKTNNTDSMSQTQREYHINKLRTQLADLERRGVVDSSLEKELAGILDDGKTASPMGAFFDKHGSNIGVSAYHGIDSIMQAMQNNKFTRGLKGKTPSEVWDGVNNSSGTMGHMMAGVRNSAQALYGIMPFVNKLPLVNSDEWDNDPSRHSITSKALGATHLATRGANLISHMITRDNHRLTAEQARLLSYYNRRHGVPDEIRTLHAARKRRNQIRLALRLLGQGILPAMFAFRYKQKSKGTHTSPGLAIANSSGILDSLLGLYDRYQSNKVMKRLKNLMPAFAEEMRLNPATKDELRDDELAAGGSMQMPDLPTF